MDDPRPTEELVLPDSGAKVTLFAYLLSGDFRLIQRKILEPVKVDFNPNKSAEEQVKEISVSGTLALDRQELILDLLVKEIHDSKGTKVENIKDFVYNLTVKDGDLLYKRIDELTSDSNLSEETKKK